MVKIIYKEHITREEVRANPNTLYVFGDNMRRAGFGGQAKEMRDEPNSVGIPTKIKPAMTPDSFFSDRDFDTAKRHIDEAFNILLAHKGPIVWPRNGIGTNRARLAYCAPKIFAYIKQKIKELEEA